MVDIHNRYTTINEILFYQRMTQPNAVAYRFIKGNGQSEIISYELLYEKVCSLAVSIQQKVRPFDKVILAAKPGLDFLIGFYACLLARVISIPIFPPANLAMSTRFLQVLKKSTPTLILYDKETYKRLNRAHIANNYLPTTIKGYLGLNAIHTDIFNEIKNRPIQVLKIACRATRVDENKLRLSNNADLAFFQYTSGSIGDPKGVMLSHANLLDNMKIMYQIMGYSADTHAYSWLPPYHDMGLIAGILVPFYAGVPATFRSTIDFLERPSSWVEDISKYQCTLTGAPNFAYDLCARKTSDEIMEQIDLSSLESAANGAEPISWHSMNLFYDKFKRAGLRKGVIFPCYCLAEATLMVSAKPKLAEDRVLYLNPSQLKKNIVEVVPRQKPGQPIVSSGLPQQEVKIVDCTTLTECKENSVGEIWVAGNSVAQGYFNVPAETERTFNGRMSQFPSNGKKYLRTGDLGFINGGELFVCGRLKDLIILSGQNYYPQDIELIVSSCDDAIRKGGIVAYSAMIAGHETLVLVAETQSMDFQRIIKNIKKSILVNFNLAVHQVYLISPGTIPKTTSGKLQRAKCKELIESQAMTILYSYSQKVFPIDNTARQAHVNWLMLIEQASVKERAAVVKRYINQLLLDVLLLAGEESLEGNKQFVELGLSSLILVDLLYQLNSELKLTVPLTSASLSQMNNTNDLIDYILQYLPKAKMLELVSNG